MPTGARSKVQDVISVDYTGPIDTDKMPFMSEHNSSHGSSHGGGNLIRARRNAK